MSSFEQTKSYGTVVGKVRRILRLEALAVLAAAISAYLLVGGNLWLLVILFFAPDLAFAGYAVGAKAGAAVYNAAHSYLMPIGLGGLGLYLKVDLLHQLALIWIAHIAFDRSLGYGLKYASAFGHTHLGEVGKKKRK